MTERWPLVVVGAGPAGLAAARAAASAGIRVLLVEEAPRPGGQIYKHPAWSLPHGHPLWADTQKALAAIGVLDEAGGRLTWWPETLAWNLTEERRLSLVRAGRGIELEAEALIVATGAYDRPQPVPGWTLPGVMTAGGVQSFLKAYGVLPGRRFLLSGVGPLQLALADQLLRAGGEVVAVLDANPPGSMTAALLRAWRFPELVREGLRYLWTLLRARVPLRGAAVAAAIEGRSTVERARWVQLDSHGRPLRQGAQEVEVGTVCLGFGFVPSIQLTLLAGAQHRWVTALGGWVPERTPSFETTVAGLYSVGDGAGVRGALNAKLEGAIAGLSVAVRLGALPPSEGMQRITLLRRQLSQLYGFTDTIGTLLAPRSGLLELLTPSTILCRCEEVTVGEVEEAIRHGVREVNGLKRMTRVGMGLCQGRMCGPTASQLMAARLGIPLESTSPLTPRPPIKPIPLGVLG